MSKTVEDVFKDHQAMGKMLDIIGGKWIPAVLYAIHLGAERHGDLSRTIPGISKKMLTKGLRDLERDGLIERTIFAEIPPRVEYKVTKLGKRFVVPLVDMCKWADKNIKHIDDVLAIRERAEKKK